METLSDQDVLFDLSSSIKHEFETMYKMVCKKNMNAWHNIIVLAVSSMQSIFSQAPEVS